MNKLPFLSTARAIYATVFICSLGAVTPAEAVTITGISGNQIVTGFLSDSSGTVFDDSNTSTDTDGILVSVLGGNNFNVVESVIGGNIINGTNPRITASTNSAVRANGGTNYSFGTFAYELIFNIDVAADFSLFNNTTAGFPEADSDNGSASINISLLRLNDSVIFSYDAPANGSAGTYAAGTILAGTYKFLMNGSVEAIGQPGSPFAPTINGRSIAEVSLGFSDATSVVPVPAAFWLFGSGMLGLIGLARRQKA